MAKGGEELASAYVTLYANLQNADKDIERQLSTIDTSKTGKTLGSKLGNSIKTSMANAVKSGLKGLAVAAGAALASAVAVGKAALDAYADYEQLVGGVDTLFKESSGKLQQYAADAYKTAGMSANQYMELSTSFAASLLQSLDGDTAAAADYANKAITDMSDNANKMGTDIERITDAYQGFAKQNFTMLDNLKLGYGGTKTEMERLLADATAISGIEYDISSYADIVEAIHVIQTEMGITGTTAKEASETISGSISAAQAAWSNWLSGLANDEADIQALTSNLANSVITAASNIVPRVGEIVTSLGAWLGENLPIMLDNLVAEISANGVAMSTAALDMFGSILTALGEMTPQILQALLLMLASLVVAIGYKVGEFFNKGIELMKGAASGIASGAAFVLSEIGRGISEGVARIGGFVGQFITAGKNLVAGIARGVSNAAGEVWNAITRICSNALNRIKSFFGIASPSKLMIKTFGYVGDGMAEGLKRSESGVLGQMTSIVGKANSIAESFAPSFGMNSNFALQGAGGGTVGGTAYYFGDINITAQSLEDVATIEQFVAMLKRARQVNPVKASGRG